MQIYVDGETAVDTLTNNHRVGSRNPGTHSLIDGEGVSVADAFTGDDDANATDEFTAFDGDSNSSSGDDSAAVTEGDDGVHEADSSICISSKAGDANAVDVALDLALWICGGVGMLSERLEACSVTSSRASARKREDTDAWSIVWRR